MIMKKRKNPHEYPHREMTHDGPLPTDVCMTNIEDFVKNEIVATKCCGCECCSYRRMMLRGIQDIITNYKAAVKIINDKDKKI